MKSFEIIVSGKVQGVGYRFFVLKKANLYNIRGIVKNQPDGSVKIIATGKQANLNIFIEELKKGSIFVKRKQCGFF